MAKQVWKASFFQWFKGLRGGPCEFTETFLAEDSVDKACKELIRHAMQEVFPLEKKEYPASKVKIVSIEKVGEPLDW